MACMTSVQKFRILIGFNMAPNSLFCQTNMAALISAHNIIQYDAPFLSIQNDLPGSIFSILI